MIVGVAREGIDPAEEGPAHDPLNTVINPDLIRDHDLRAIPPCHARMLHIGSRCLGPVGRRPGLRHDGQTYRRRCRLFSSQRKLWVALNVRFVFFSKFGGCLLSFLEPLPSAYG